MSNSFAIPWTVACQAPLSMGFPRQEYWSGLPFPTPGDLANPGIEPMSPALTGRFLTTSTSTFPVSGDKDVSAPLGTRKAQERFHMRDLFHMTDLIHAFRRTNESQSVLLASADF